MKWMLVVGCGFVAGALALLHEGRGGQAVAEGIRTADLSQGSTDADWDEPTERASPLVIPGADGADGDFTFVPDSSDPNVMTINLAAATTGLLEVTQPDVAGQGVYDPMKWAVVFRYTSVNVPSGKTVRFANHPASPPVVWLVSGDVSIMGVVDLSGRDQSYNGGYAIPGPGGFRGGQARTSSGAHGSAGFGPGGGHHNTLNQENNGPGGSYAAQGDAGNGVVGPTYGNADITPLIGGSGGAAAAGYNNDGNPMGNGGGAGGGAILIAATGICHVGGVIHAKGGAGALYAYRLSGGGSGGAIKLVADVVTTTSNSEISAISKQGGLAGGFGRIAIHCNSCQVSGRTYPASSPQMLEGPVVLWPDETTPTVRIASIGAVAAPVDPHARIDAPADLGLQEGENQAVLIEGENIPVDGSWAVIVRIVPARGADFTVPATYTSGDQDSSVWTAIVDFADGAAVLQARAYAQ